jgi:hypothetical protein
MPMPAAASSTQIPASANARAQRWPGRNTCQVNKNTADQPTPMVNVATDMAPRSAGSGTEEEAAVTTSSKGHATAESSNSAAPISSSGRALVRRASQSSFTPTAAPTATKASAESNARSSSPCTRMIGARRRRGA